LLSNPLELFFVSLAAREMPTALLGDVVSCALDLEGLLGCCLWAPSVAVSGRVASSLWTAATSRSSSSNSSSTFSSSSTGSWLGGFSSTLGEPILIDMSTVFSASEGKVSLERIAFSKLLPCDSHAVGNSSAGVITEVGRGCDFGVWRSAVWAGFGELLDDACGD
jgi:hypothetical protein